MDKTKIYISGKITGLSSDSVTKHFGDAELLLREIGLQPVNPLKNGLTENHTWKQHMVRDIELLFDCGGILMLDNWKESTGATIEYDIAKRMKLDIWYQSNVSRIHEKIRHIQNAIHEVMGLTYNEYTTKSRKRDYVFARMIMTHQCHKLGINPQQYIWRDRTMVYQYMHKYIDECRFNPKFRVIAEKVDESIKNMI